MNARNFQVDKGELPLSCHVPSPKDILSASKQQVVNVVSRFILEARDKKGDEYNRNTLYDLITMVNSYFKSNKLPYNFFEDDEFFDLRNVLDNRMKDLTKRGLIAPRVKAVPVSVSEEDMLWSKKILGDDTPEKLSNTLILLLGIQFAMRAAKEHKSLKVDQIVVKYDKDLGQRYLFYTEYYSKCNQGGIKSRSNDGKKGRCYENVANKERCLVSLHELYIAHRPNSFPRTEKDPIVPRNYYLHPLSSNHSDIWYCCQPRGRHAIEKVVGKLCREGGLKGKRTNHSARAAAATRMFEVGMDEQLICEKTGHRSVAVRSYKRTSSNQLKQVSDVLYGNIEPTTQSAIPCKKSKPTATISIPPKDESE